MWRDIFFHRLRGGAKYHINNLYNPADYTFLYMFQGNALGFKTPYKVEYWNTSTNAWEDITTGYNWGVITDMRSSSSIALGGIQSGTIRIRFYYNMGGIWASSSYALAVVMQHGGYIDYVKVEHADDSDMTTNLGTCLEISETIITASDCSIVFPLTSSPYRQYQRIDIQFRSTLYPTHMFLKELMLLEHGFWSRGLMETILPIQWDYNKNVYPGSDNTCDLGSSTYYWKRLYLANQLISKLATGTAPLNVQSTTVCTNLNADLHDGYHAGNSSGQIPVSNSTVCTNLNADLLDGKHSSEIVKVYSVISTTQRTLTAPTTATDDPDIYFDLDPAGKPVLFMLHCVHARLTATTWGRMYLYDGSANIIITQQYGTSERTFTGFYLHSGWSGTRTVRMRWQCDSGDIVLSEFGQYRQMVAIVLNG
jgi:hypothetical protein